MNFDKAREYSFLVPWKTMECFSGPDCWCRMVVPIDPVYYVNPESPDVKHEYVVVDAGALDQKTAEYIVELHNECREKYFDRVIQNCRDAMKETMDSWNLKKEYDKLNIGPRSVDTIEMNEIVETFEKLWENKHSTIRKIVRKEID